ncbi:MAG TPA: VCBS repeat-containing protein [Pseudomonadota bacterium]|nr:VCBS repeat-containing protein [Pseudomonadota bacterium]
MSLRCPAGPWVLAFFYGLLGAVTLPACEREVLLGYLSPTPASHDAGADSGPAGDPLRFRTALSLALELEPQAIASADLDRDGQPDLIVAHGAAKLIRAFLGSGDGTFPRVADTACGAATAGLVVADFNADQRPDLAVSLVGPGQVQVLAGRGDGTFTAARTYATGSGPLAAADLNGDGRPDLAIATASEVVILLSGPLGVGFEPLTPARYPIAGAASALAAGDLNRDRFIDLAVALGGLPQLAVLSNSGSGGFSLSSAALVEPSQTMALVALDGSGAPKGAVTGASTLTLLENQGGRLTQDLKLGFRYPVGPDPRLLQSADFDLDGHLDLLTASASEPTLSVLFGSGAGDLRHAAATVRLAAPAAALSIGDWNHDAVRDLAVVTVSPPQLHVMLGGEQPERGD